MKNKRNIIPPKWYILRGATEIVPTSPQMVWCCLLAPTVIHFINLMHFSPEMVTSQIHLCWRSSKIVGMGSKTGAETPGL